MLDLKWMREHPDEVRVGLSRLHVEDAPLDRILELDARRRELLVAVEELRGRRNEGSRRVPRLEGEDREQLVAELKEVSEQISGLEVELAEVEAELERQMLWMPNMPYPGVPDGAGEDENVVVETWGEQRRFEFDALPHWKLGTRLGVMDFERAVRMSGTRAYVLRGWGARLLRALSQYMLDFLTRERGYVEAYLPYMVREEAMVGTGNLPKFEDTLYRDVDEDRWLIPTAEVPLVNLYREEILEAEELPIKLAAWTPCFRREKAAAGRDTRGIKRVHQFDKVEQVQITRPEDSAAALDEIIANAREILERLDLPYRVVQMCAGDLGFQAAIKFDLEVWAPGAEEWLEVSSCSNCDAFQARRARIRYRPEPGARPELVHTLNGSALGMVRTLAAVVENYQRPDGSVATPEVLRPYM